ncbi:MAG: hypothetical protein IT425_08635 [Pirellulales bacterium]|nr:hypothetical protein [Pirellulales bacterium]
MNARLRTNVLSLFVVLTLSTATTSTIAAPPKKALLLNPGGSYDLPRFGFASASIPGYGERVVHVHYGSRAAMLGLEPGDVILSLNGYPLTYAGSWNDALANALFEGNYISLQIRDVRTGLIMYRETMIGFEHGPVVPHFRKMAPRLPEPPVNVHPVSPLIKTAKGFTLKLAN